MVSTVKTIFALLSVCLWLAAALPTLRAQNEIEIRVTFVLTSPDLPDSSTLYITGGIPQLGMWDPGKVRMESRAITLGAKKLFSNAPCRSNTSTRSARGSMRVHRRPGASIQFRYSGIEQHHDQGHDSLLDEGQPATRQSGTDYGNR